MPRNSQHNNCQPIAPIFDRWRLVSIFHYVQPGLSESPAIFNVSDQNHPP
jgi:hypothetical protein